MELLKANFTIWPNLAAGIHLELRWFLVRRWWQNNRQPTGGKQHLHLHQSAANLAMINTQHLLVWSAFNFSAFVSFNHSSLHSSIHQIFNFMTYRLELFKGNGHQHVCTMLKTHNGAHLMVEDLQNINPPSHSHLHIFILQILLPIPIYTSSSSNLLADHPLHKE